MNNYLEFNFKIFPLQPWNEILMAELIEIGFDSFTEEHDGILGYIQKDLFNENQLKEINLFKNDEVKISDTLFNKDFKVLELVTFKRFNERETRILILLNMKKENLNKIKARISEIISDKEVKDILYKGRHDFYGLQFLEYLKENYNIEYGGY